MNFYQGDWRAKNKMFKSVVTCLNFKYRKLLN
jgi:hypothetical protein